MSTFRIVSSDDHVFEPPDMWTSWVASKYRDRAPCIVRLESGDDWWFTDSIKGVPVATGSQTGLRFQGNKHVTVNDQMEQVRPGAYDPDERVRDMDLDGVDTSVIYPNQGLILYSIPDTELVNALFIAYNDWLAEYCQTHPKRLKGIGLINLDDIEWAVEELKRCHRIGLVGATVPVSPVPSRPYYLAEYEPLWTLAEELGVPLSLHTGTQRPVSVAETTDIEDLRPEFFSTQDYYVRMSLSRIIYGGMFERHPKLIVGSVEHDAGWASYFLYTLDYNYTQRFQLKHWHRYRENMLPSDYFHRNVFVSFQEDALSIRERHIIGVDNLQWGSDYPHIESTFPRSREILDEILADCSDEEKAKIAGGNAARVYRI